MEYKYWLFMIAAVVISSLSQILLKKSTLKERKNIVQEYLNPYVIIGYGMLFCSTLFYVMAYTGLDYKNGPIIEALGYIFVLILSCIFIGEKITPKKILGNILILCGIFVFYR